MALATGRSIDEVRHYPPELLRTVLEELKSGATG